MLMLVVVVLGDRQQAFSFLDICSGVEHFLQCVPLLFGGACTQCLTNHLSCVPVAVSCRFLLLDLEGAHERGKKKKLGEALKTAYR